MRIPSFDSSATFLPFAVSSRIAPWAEQKTCRGVAKPSVMSHFGSAEASGQESGEPKLSGEVTEAYLQGIEAPGLQQVACFHK